MTSKEAYERLDWVLHKLADALGVNFPELAEDYDFNDTLEKMQELSIRDTPLQVDKVDITPLAHYYYYCKACHVSQGSSEVDRSHKHFCYNCGQRLDWS